MIYVKCIRYENLYKFFIRQIHVFSEGYGVIRLATDLTLHPNVTTYDLVIEATDLGDPPLTSVLTLRVDIVSDVGIPRFTQRVYEMEVWAGRPVGGKVGRVEAIGDCTYHIIGKLEVRTSGKEFLVYGKNAVML